MSSGWLPGYDIVDTGRYSNYAGQNYYPYKPIILLHMTVGMGLSRSYVAGHTVPPHLWYNVYNGDKFQTAPLDMAARALYQPQYGYHWTNKHDYLLQTELVGIPVVNQRTYNDEHCRLIAENVIVPQVLWLRENGLDVDLNSIIQIENSSGSASEYWHGRGSEQEMADFNGIAQHIWVWGNDHWDCSVERLDLMAQYAREILGQGPTPIKKKVIPRMISGYYRMNPKDRTQRAVWNDKDFGAVHVIDLTVVHPGGRIYHHPKDDGTVGGTKLFFRNHQESNHSEWGEPGSYLIPSTAKDRWGNVGTPGFASVVVPAGIEYSVWYVPPAQ